METLVRVEVPGPERIKEVQEVQVTGKEVPNTIFFGDCHQNRKKAATLFSAVTLLSKFARALTFQTI